jgi:CrcB protein
MNLLWHAGAAAAGGAVGAALRFALNELFVRRGWYGLPMATFIANVLGCFAAGLVLVWLDTRGALAPLWRNLLMVGVLGGLTTFSALGVELWQLLRAGRWELIALTAGATLMFGVLAVAAGFRLGKAIWG